MGRALNWETEVAVGVGSSECLYACMQALVNPGDEVILIAPGACAVFAEGLVRAEEVLVFFALEPERAPTSA